MLPDYKERTLVDALLMWHQKNRRNFPWRQTRGPYLTLVAEFFLQRTPADRVATILPTFIKEFPALDKLAGADLEKVTHDYASLGLRKRLSWLIESMKIVLIKFDGRIPNDYRGLMSLPGIGEYTASAVLCFGFGQRVSIMDTNVLRVFGRVFGLCKEQKQFIDNVKKIALRLLPESRYLEFNEAILDLGALICRKVPLCNRCPLNALCDYYKSSNFRSG